MIFELLITKNRINTILIYHVIDRMKIEFFENLLEIENGIV